MKKVPLVRVSPQGFPRLPDWRSSRFLPEDPSWLDRGGKFFKEGMTAYYTERPLEALKHFLRILSERLKVVQGIFLFLFPVWIFLK